MMNYGWCETCHTQLVYGTYKFKEGTDATTKTGWFCPNCREIRTITTSNNTEEQG